MSRSLPEWIGKTDNDAIPPRVRVRIFEFADGVCCCGCFRKIRAGERWEVHHILPLILGGAHRENNLKPILYEHHKEQTRKDAAAKSKLADRRKRHLGIRKRSSFPCGRDSKFKKKISGDVVRR